MPRSGCVENCSNNAKSHTNLNFYVLPSDKLRRRCWLQAVGQAQQHLRLCTPCWLINCLQRKCISAVLRQNPMKHATNIHPDVFNSFCRTVTHGESHGIIYNLKKLFYCHSIFLHLNLPVEIS